MRPVAPESVHEGARRIVFAEDQPQYEPLPAAVDGDGLVLTEWEFTAEELERVVRGGRLRLWLYTYRRPLQPVQLEVAEPRGPAAEGEGAR